SPLAWQFLHRSLQYQTLLLNNAGSMGIVNCPLRVSRASLADFAVLKLAMQILTVGTDQSAIWEFALLSARALLIATLGKFALAVALAEFLCNVPRPQEVAVAVPLAVASPATTLKAESAGRYDGRPPHS